MQAIFTHNKVIWEEASRKGYVTALIKDQCEVKPILVRNLTFQDCTIWQF